MTYLEIKQRLDGLDRERRRLELALKAMTTCEHPRMPERRRFEEHMDACPDCGYVSYLYKG